MHPIPRLESDTKENIELKKVILKEKLFVMTVCDSKFKSGMYFLTNLSDFESE